MGSDSKQKRFFFYSIASRQILRPNKLPLQWVPEVKQLGCEAIHQCPSSAEVKMSGANVQSTCMPS